MTDIQIDYRLIVEKATKEGLENLKAKADKKTDKKADKHVVKDGEDATDSGDETKKDDK